MSLKIFKFNGFHAQFYSKAIKTYNRVPDGPFILVAFPILFEQPPVFTPIFDYKRGFDKTDQCRFDLNSKSLLSRRGIQPVHLYRLCISKGVGTSRLGTNDYPTELSTHEPPITVNFSQFECQSKRGHDYNSLENILR